MEVIIKVISVNSIQIVGRSNFDTEFVARMQKSWCMPLTCLRMKSPWTILQVNVTNKASIFTKKDLKSLEFPNLFESFFYNIIK